MLFFKNGLRRAVLIELIYFKQIFSYKTLVFLVEKGEHKDKSLKRGVTELERKTGVELLGTNFLSVCFSDSCA